MANVLFRVDGDRHVGLGHLQRCLSLGEALRTSGARCFFLTNGTPAVQVRVTSFGFEAAALEGGECWSLFDLKRAVSLAGHYQCNAIVVDSYHVDADYLGYLRAAGLFVVAIDDLARSPFPCQLVVNGSAHALQLPYGSSSGDTRFLLGPQYALLRPEFWDVPSRGVDEIVHNVLVTLGGVDRHNLMPRLLTLLDDLHGEFTVTAVIGPFFENRPEVEEVASHCRRVVGLMEAPDSVRDLMLEADVAVSAGGQTLYELAATGTPTVAVQVADNQAGSLSALAAKGIVLMAGCAGDAGLLASLEVGMQRLLRSRGLRKEMSEAGRRLGAGPGAVRVAEVFDSMQRRG